MVTNYGTDLRKQNGTTHGQPARHFFNEDTGLFDLRDYGIGDESGSSIPNGNPAESNKAPAIEWPAPTASVKFIGGSLQQGDDPWDAGWITTEELQAANVTTEYHVRDIIPANEPMIVGGPAKGMKTSIIGDTLLCASSGETFGDAGDGYRTFEVQTPVRCGFVSCESGFAAIKKTLSGIAASRGRELRDYSDLFLRAEKYDLCDPKTHVQIARLVSRKTIRILMFDPTFLMLSGMGDDASNIFKQGEKLEPLTRIARDYGVTLGLLHHYGKGVLLNSVGKKPELSWLSHAGFDAWARAWILIARREAYNAATPGVHRMSMIIGGSAGHSLDIAADIDEGFRYPNRTCPPVYSLTIRDSADVQGEDDDQQHDKELDKKNARKEKIAVRNAASLLGLLERTRGPVTMTQARSGTGIKLDGTDVLTAMGRLVSSGHAKETATKASNGREIHAWEIVR